MPGLDKLFRLGLSFDLILLSAVWMHVPPTDRARTFRKLVTLLKPGGCIAITLRHGPAEPERGIYDVSQAEIDSSRPTLYAANRPAAILPLFNSTMETRGAKVPEL